MIGCWSEYETFLEWNPDPSVASAAEALYGHVDHLELYVCSLLVIVSTYSYIRYSRV